MLLPMRCLYLWGFEVLNDVILSSQKTFKETATNRFRGKFHYHIAQINFRMTKRLSFSQGVPFLVHLVLYYIYRIYTEEVIK